MVNPLVVDEVRLPCSYVFFDEFTQLARRVKPARCASCLYIADALEKHLEVVVALLVDVGVSPTIFISVFLVYETVLAKILGVLVLFNGIGSVGLPEETDVEIGSSNFSKKCLFNRSWARACVLLEHPSFNA